MTKPNADLRATGVVECIAFLHKDRDLGEEGTAEGEKIFFSYDKVSGLMVEGNEHPLPLSSPPLYFTYSTRFSHMRQCLAMREESRTSL